jgi:hypothetical protein
MPAEKVSRVLGENIPDRGTICKSHISPEPPSAGAYFSAVLLPCGRSPAKQGPGRERCNRELAQLVEAGLVRRVPHGRQVYLSADPASPVFDELRRLLAENAGIADVLRAAPGPLAQRHRIAAAFVYGSVAEGGSLPPARRA